MSAPRKVSALDMPRCSHGFRSGWARATVDGQRMQIYTSRSDRSDYSEHCRDVLAQFAAGEGEVTEGGAR